MLGAVGWATIQGIEVPWDMFGYYTALLAVMAMCFLGIGMLISAIARTTDIAQGAADCNENGVPDSCDIASGASDDLRRPSSCPASAQSALFRAISDNISTRPRSAGC